MLSLAQSRSQLPITHCASCLFRQARWKSVPCTWTGWLGWTCSTSFLAALHSVWSSELVLTCKLHLPRNLYQSCAALTVTWIGVNPGASQCKNGNNGLLSFYPDQQHQLQSRWQKEKHGNVLWLQFVCWILGEEMETATCGADVLERRRWWWFCSNAILGPINSSAWNCNFQLVGLSHANQKWPINPWPNQFQPNHSHMHTGCLAGGCNFQIAPSRQVYHTEDTFISK